MHAFHPVFTIAIPFSAALARRPWIAYNAASSPPKKVSCKTNFDFFFTLAPVKFIRILVLILRALHGQGPA